MKKHYRHEKDCLNCGAILQGKFCHVCGQENLQITESFGHMMNDIISDFFHFDHQFFQTIRPLLFRPGFLTVEYMAGKRASYLHPVKMYIFISVVYFLVIFQTGHKVVAFNENKGKPKTGQGTLDTARREMAKDTNLAPGHRSAIRFKRLPSTKNDGKMGTSKIFSVDGDTTLKEYAGNQAKLPPSQRDGWFGKILSERLIDYDEKYGNRAGEQFQEDIEHNIPKMMFVVLPVIALMLGFTFYKSGKFYVEHLIYALHLTCFIFLLITIVALIEIPIPDKVQLTQWINLLIGIYIFWYIYRSLRVVYHRGVIRTITKLIGLLLSYLLLSTVCITLVVLITALL
jgi:hypothetical protein